MATGATYKKKVNKLTFYNGRMYQAGETVEFLPEDAEAAKVHYGEAKPTDEPSEQTPADTAAVKQAASVKAAKQAASE